MAVAVAPTTQATAAKAAKVTTAAVAVAVALATNGYSSGAGGNGGRRLHLNHGTLGGGNGVEDRFYAALADDDLRTVIAEATVELDKRRTLTETPARIAALYQRIEDAERGHETNRSRSPRPNGRTQSKRCAPSGGPRPAPRDQYQWVGGADGECFR